MLNISCYRPLLCLGLSLFISYSAAAAEMWRDLNESGLWQKAKVIELSESQQKFVVSEPGSELRFAQATPDVPELRSSSGFGDAWLVTEFQLSKEASAALLLQGRYGITLANKGAGGLIAGPDQNRVPGQAPLKQQDLTPGVWHRLEVRFRAPRFDEAYNKVDPAMFLDVRLNGELVQQNARVQGFSRNPIFNWEEQFGPLALKLYQGSIALKSLNIRHADFSALTMPDDAGKTNLDELTDFVALGKQTYASLGCGTCHAVEQDDESVKSGPNLFGLFRAQAREREVVEGDDQRRFTIKADRSYLHASVRTPSAQLAIAERGKDNGNAYMPIMPAYSEQVVSEQQIDAIGAYLATLNQRAEQGPVIKLVTPDGPKHYDPLEDSLQFLVKDRVRIQRGPMAGMSGRSIHVGQPNAIHYSFDPRLLAVVKIWQGGFLEVSGEWQNRGGGGLKTGFEARLIDLGGDYLFAPLSSRGELIDFSFKEAVFNDFETVNESLYSEVDHLDRIAAVDAQFLGYELNSKQPEAAPSFRYRLGSNRLAVTHALAADGKVSIEVSGEVKAPQQFTVNESVLRGASVSLGEIRGGVWHLPAGTKSATLSAQLAVASNPWKPTSAAFNHLRQPLNKVEAKADLPPGYRIESYLPPKDNFARPQLFEALGLALAKDGTVVVATRTAGIWRLVKGEWHLFAEGIFDSLGVEIEDDKGLQLVVGQKAELTRIKDTNGDGLADSFETLFDAHSFHGNYHTYMHGPAKGGDGAYYIAINLAHSDQAIYKAGGMYMGASGGFMGWAIRVSPKGEATLFANGLRSPAGIAAGPDGRIWYSDNQGEFVATSKLFELKKDAFYGHPSGLVDLPGMNPDSAEIAWEKVSAKREKAAVLFPHNTVANSPGHPVWDTTKGRFGAFAGQMFIGDQTQSNLLRVVTETVNGVEQGVVMPFADKMESGVMRPVFLPDGSLLVGQTGRGWSAKGGHVASLQRLVWDGKTTSLDLYSVSATPQGFKMTFTQPLPASIAEADLKSGLSLTSWVYRDAPDYGSEVMGRRVEEVSSLQLAADRKSLTLSLATLEQPDIHPQQTARVYHVQLALPKVNESKPLNAYYTLYQFPAR